MFFDAASTPLQCARDCRQTLHEIHAFREQGVVTAPHEMHQRYKDLSLLMRTRYTDWAHLCSRRDGSRSLVDFMVACWAHIYCFCNPVVWTRGNPTEDEVKDTQRELRLVTRRWHALPKPDSEFRDMWETFGPLATDAAHAIVTFFAGFVANDLTSEDTPDEALATSRYSDIDENKDLKNKLSDDEKIAYEERKQQGLEEEDEKNDKVGVDDDREDAFTKMALCPFRFAELLGRAWYVHWTERDLWNRHKVCAPLDPGHEWLVGLQETLDYVKISTQFSPSDASDKLSRRMLCLWYSPLGTQMTAQRVCGRTGQALPTAMSMMRQELGVSAGSKIVSMSQVLARHVLDDWDPETQALTRLQVVWILMGINRVWSGWMKDENPTSFTETYVVMPYDHIQRSDFIYTQTRWGGHWRRPCIMFVGNTWCVQVPPVFSKKKKGKSVLQQCRGFVEALHVWGSIMRSDAFKAQTIDGRRCLPALDAMRKKKRINKFTAFQ